MSGPPGRARPRITRGRVALVTVPRVSARPGPHHPRAVRPTVMPRPDHHDRSPRPDRPPPIIGRSNLDPPVSGVQRQRRAIPPSTQASPWLSDARPVDVPWPWGRPGPGWRTLPDRSAAWRGRRVGTSGVAFQLRRPPRSPLACVEAGAAPARSGVMPISRSPSWLGRSHVNHRLAGSFADPVNRCRSGDECPASPGPRNGEASAFRFDRKPAVPFASRMGRASLRTRIRQRRRSGWRLAP